MVRVAFAEKGSPLPKEEGHWRVPSVVGLVIVRCGLPSAGGTPHADVIVGVVVDDDGVVLGRPGRGAVVRVAADDDGVVSRCPGGGVPQSPAWCSTLQMMAPLRIPRSGRT